MAQKILIAFDDSENAMRAVEFVARSYSPDNPITLFHVLPDTAALCEMHSPELTDYFVAQQSNFCALEAKRKDLIQAAMARAKSVFTNAGFDAENLKLKIETKKLGVARDILNEAGDGYTMVVIGRRGLSAIKEFFLGSVSQKVLHSASGVSLLIVK